MIAVYCCQNNETVFNFTNDYMRSNFKLLPNNKMDVLYLTESIQSECLQTLDELWYEGDTPY